MIKHSIYPVIIIFSGQHRFGRSGCNRSSRISGCSIQRDGHWRQKGKSLIVSSVDYAGCPSLLCFILIPVSNSLIFSHIDLFILSRHVLCIVFKPLFCDIAFLWLYWYVIIRDDTWWHMMIHGVILKLK